MIKPVTWLPHPLLSILLLVTWLLLNNTIAPGHLLLGTLLGLLIPLFTRRFFPEPVRLHHPGLILRFVGRVIWDIILANFVVARIVLSPRITARPAFVRVPLDIEGDFAIAVLSGVISLTPGTVSADLDADCRYLLLHVLSLDEPETLVRQIKTRYEAPIKEIFAC